MFILSKWLLFSGKLCISFGTFYIRQIFTYFIVIDNIHLICALCYKLLFVLSLLLKDVMKGVRYN